MKEHLAHIVRATSTSLHGRNVAREYLQARILGVLQRQRPEDCAQRVHPLSRPAPRVGSFASPGGNPGGQDRGGYEPAGRCRPDDRRHPPSRDASTPASRPGVASGGQTKRSSCSGWARIVSIRRNPPADHGSTGATFLPCPGRTRPAQDSVRQDQGSQYRAGICFPK